MSYNPYQHLRCPCLLHRPQQPNSLQPLLFISGVEQGDGSVKSIRHGNVAIREQPYPARNNSPILFPKNFPASMRLTVSNTMPRIPIALAMNGPSPMRARRS